MSIYNKFKDKIHNNLKQYGIWNGIPHSYAAELCAGAGFDFVVIDAEHAPFSLEQIVIQLQAMSRYPDCSPIVRIPSGDPVVMKRLMDAGVQSFIIPMVESAAQAKNMVEAIHYPPKGIRGVGTALARAAQWNRVNNYFKDANDQMFLITQIESVAGVNALDEIVKVEGIDIIFLGPADLAGSMGYLGQPNHPEVVASVKSCISTIINSGKKAGILSSNKQLIQDYTNMGVTMLGVGLDTILLSNASSELAMHYKGELKSKVSNTKY
jgi:4-hydroxy-2-oxoheptanedioate aldolase